MPDMALLGFLKFWEGHTTVRCAHVQGAYKLTLVQLLCWSLWAYSYHCVDALQITNKMHCCALLKMMHESFVVHWAALRPIHTGQTSGGIGWFNRKWPIFGLVWLLLKEHDQRRSANQLQVSTLSLLAERAEWCVLAGEISPCQKTIAQWGDIAVLTSDC